MNTIREILASALNSTPKGVEPTTKYEVAIGTTSGKEIYGTLIFLGDDYVTIKGRKQYRTDSIPGEFNIPLAAIDEFYVVDSNTGMNARSCMKGPGLMPWK